QPRFTDPGLAGKEYHLTFPGLHLCPAPEQQLGFFFTPGEGGESGRVQGLEAALHGTRPKYSPDLCWPGNALKLLCPELLHLEEIAKELSRTLGNDNRVRLGHSLQPRRQVWRLADYAALVCLPCSNQVADYDEPGCNADACLQQRARLQPAHRADQRQPCAHGSLCVILMRLRVTKIDEHAVAEISGHEPAEASYSLGDGFLISRNDLTEVLRVHLGGERRRTDKVGEHHRHLSTLGGLLSGYVSRRKGVGWQCFSACLSAQGGDGVEQLTAVPDNTYAKILQVLRRQ